MGLFNTIKEKHQTARQNDVQLQAKARIRVSDFNGKLYIAYDGTPLVQIEEKWTTKEIIQQLSTLRENYINSRLG